MQTSAIHTDDTSHRLLVGAANAIREALQNLRAADSDLSERKARIASLQGMLDELVTINGGENADGHDATMLLRANLPSKEEIARELYITCFSTMAVSEDAARRVLALLDGKFTRSTGTHSTQNHTTLKDDSKVEDASTPSGSGDGAKVVGGDLIRSMIASSTEDGAALDATQGGSSIRLELPLAMALEVAASLVVVSLPAAAQDGATVDSYMSRFVDLLFAKFERVAQRATERPS